MGVNLDLPLASCLDVFGKEVQYIPAGSEEPVDGTVTVIFDRAHEFVELDGAQVPISTTGPALEAAMPDADMGSGVHKLPDVPEVGCRFVIGSETFQAYDVQPDGAGGVTLPLHLVS